MMTSPSFNLGIDISKASFNACLYFPSGSQKPLHKVFTNNSKGFAQLDDWLTQQHTSSVLAGLEATGPYAQALCHHLYSKGHSVCLLNPRHVKDFARSLGKRIKTDPSDAATIAQFLRSRDQLQLWQPPAEHIVVLQALLRRRLQLMDELQAERNRLEDISLPAVVRLDIKGHVKQLLKRVTDATAALEHQVLTHPDLQKSVRLLRSIPGVGLMVAITILAEVPAIMQFRRARELAAFAGLTPTLAQSGTSVHRRGHMSREGSALLRKMLYMAALQSVKRLNNPLHAVYQAFVDRGKAKMCALVAIMHKILRIAYGVLKQKQHSLPTWLNFKQKLKNEKNIQHFQTLSEVV